MLKLILSLCLLLISNVSSLAWTHGVLGSTGHAQLNLGSGEVIPANFINVLKVAALSFNTASDASKVNDAGYLTSAPSNSVNLSWPVAGTTFLNVPYKISWPATIQFQLRFNTLMTGCVAVNTTVTGCSGAGTTTFTTNGSAGSVTFTPTTQLSAFFVAGAATFTHTAGELALYRVSDEADYLAGEYFTPEFRNLLIALNPRTIRPMGWVQSGPANFNGETTWVNRASPTTMTWKTRFPPGIWGGTIGGTDTYTASAAPNTPVTWTDGEQYIGTFTNANTSTTVTIDIGGRGAKTVVKNDGFALLSTSGAGTNNIVANAIGTLTYDGILDKVLWNPGGLQVGIPIEAQIQLSNKIKANLWAIIPPWASDNYITNWSTVVKNNLFIALYFYAEPGNEIWNFAFPQTQWSLQRGCALGFTAASNGCTYGYYGLRVRQIMGNLIPTVWADRMTRLRRVMAYQAAGDSTSVTFRFNGRELAPSGVSTGTGNAVYNSFTGSADYTTFPNRPIDVADVLAYAPYVVGTNMCMGPDFNCTPTAANAPFFQALVTAWESGDSSASITMIDNDIRIGRTLAQNVTASGTTFTTPLAHGFTSGTTTVIPLVTGGTIYSGLTATKLYLVNSTPTSTTFTIQAYSGGFPSGANVNAGSVGTGITTIGAALQKNLQNVASTWYQFGETNAALYDSVRNGAGISLLRVEQYEGNPEPKGPSAAQCTTMGIVGSDCTGSVAAALLAWKNSNLAKLTQALYYNQFMGLDSTLWNFGLMPHSQTPSQLVLLGAGDYGFISGSLPTSTPYQTYYGAQCYNLGLC